MITPRSRNSDSRNLQIPNTGQYESRQTAGHFPFPPIKNWSLLIKLIEKKESGIFKYIIDQQ